MSFNIASRPRTFDRTSNAWKDGEPLYIGCTLWRDLAQHAAATFHKGDRVIAVGKLRQRSFESKDGTRTVIELDVDEIGPSIKFGPVSPAASGSSSGVHRPAAARPPAARAPEPVEDPWASETPF